MSIRFIVGASGTGKTRYIYNRMIEESMKKEHAPIIYILPEQSNMIAEQDMISLHPMNGTMDISILSFTRLAYQVFDKGNIYTGDVLDDYGKSMLVMKVLGEHAEELTYYGNMVGKTGFIDEMKSVISEFYQYGITVDRIDELLESISDDNSLYHKLKDIKIILSGFEKAMGDTFMVTEQILSLLAEHISDSEMLRNAEVYFDGFTGFTPVQYRVIRQMMNNCGNLYFSITMDDKIIGDNSYSSSGLFGIGKDTVFSLVHMAEEEKVTVLPHISLEKNMRLENNEELFHLEKNIFRFPIKELNDNDSDYGSSCLDEDCGVLNNLTAVNIIECNDVYDEIRSIGRMIRWLVRDKGYNYRDIAVVTGDLDDNIEIWKQIMEQMEITYFTDANELLSHNQIAEVLSMVFEIFETDFSFDSVFSFLKTGFFDIDMSKIYELENYAAKYGIHGFNWWNSPFRGNMKNLGKINKTRKLFMDGLSDIAKIFLHKEGRAEEYIKALYFFMEQHHMGEKLWEQALIYEKEGLDRQAMAYKQSYEKFLNVLDKTMDILSDEVISRKLLGEVLAAGISDIRLGIIPSTLDQIVIGDMERTRFHNIKVLFMAGSNEGLLPRPIKTDGILTDKDKKKLMEFNVTLSPVLEASYYTQQFYLYMQMTQTSDKLIVSYRKNDRKGNALNVSFFVKYIMQMFPYKSIIDSSYIIANILPSTVEDMLKELSYDLSHDFLGDSSLYKVLSSAKRDVVASMLEGYMYMNQPGTLNEAITRKLYGDRMVHSVSRLESFAMCEYQFFLRYGLELNKPEEYKIESNHIGTILHTVMESFFRELKDGAISVPMEEAAIDAKVRDLTIKAAEEVNDTIFDSDYRSKHELEVIVRIAGRSVRNLLRHLDYGEMKPEYIEKKFSPDDDISYINMQLSKDVIMGLSGKIDRVDIKETEDAVYVKVIDYKSGDKDIDFVKVIEGKQLQLAVYMSVMVEYLQKKYPGKRIIPTGMFYYQLADKIVDGYSEEELESKRIKESRMSGLVNRDDECLEMLDRKTGLAVPVTYNKDMELTSNNSHVVTGGELKAISDFTRNKMIELGDKIIHGEIDMRPQKGGKSSPCNYCDYLSVCRFEAGLGGNAHGIGLKLSKEEAKELIFGTNNVESDDSN